MNKINDDMDGNAWNDSDNGGVLVGDSQDLSESADAKSRVILRQAPSVRTSYSKPLSHSYSSVENTGANRLPTLSPEKSNFSTTDLHSLVSPASPQGTPKAGSGVRYAEEGDRIEALPFATDIAPKNDITAPALSGIAPSSSRMRVYKSTSSINKWVTREIAALDFLLGVPMRAEKEIVHYGWRRQHGLLETRANDDSSRSLTNDDEENSMTISKLSVDTQSRSAFSSVAMSSVTSHRGKWWEKWITPILGGDPNSKNDIDDFENVLELPSSKDTVNASEKGDDLLFKSNSRQQQTHRVALPLHVPGRRLEGDLPHKVQIPLTVDAKTRQRSIARQAAIREWELKVAHGIGGDTNDISPAKMVVGGASENSNRPPLLDGRIFFSAAESYPMAVFSLLRYEPKKEEAARRRQKLEARGGGGTQFFIIPQRDWRGISYRALLAHPNTDDDDRKRSRRSTKLVPLFDRFATKGDVDTTTTAKDGITDASSISSLDDLDEDDIDEKDPYVPGLLDDPDMVQGRHRTVMIGDRVTGCIVSSTIQFVKPSLLKADLNKQFRERFDGWEPPRSQHKYIGARVIDGIYTLADPGNEDGSSLGSGAAGGATSPRPRRRTQSGPLSGMSNPAGNDVEKEIIRMPPSLTLSKIRSIKQQALLAAVKAKIEISSVALSFVYFERLCLDCRIDKTNRRLSFAACLLLAVKYNEPYVLRLVMANEKKSSDNDEPADKDETDTAELAGGESSSGKKLRNPLKRNNNGKADNESSKKSGAKRPTMHIQSLVRPTRKINTVFASLLEFFTQEWSLSLQHLFAAEWGVFAALQFRLHAKPSQVAFHYKRCLKNLGWDAQKLLGDFMYEQFQDALSNEEFEMHQLERKRQQKEETRMLRLQRELERREQVVNDPTPPSSPPTDGRRTNGGDIFDEKEVESTVPPLPDSFAKGKGKRLRLAQRLSMDRTKQSTTVITPEPKSPGAQKNSGSVHQTFSPNLRQGPRVGMMKLFGKKNPSSDRLSAFAHSKMNGTSSSFNEGSSSNTEPPPSPRRSVSNNNISSLVHPVLSAPNIPVPLGSDSPNDNRAGCLKPSIDSGPEGGDDRPHTSSSASGQSESNEADVEPRSDDGIMI